MKWTLVVAFAFVILTTRKILCMQENVCPVYITISLSGMDLEESFLEVKWGPGCSEAPEWIGLFKEDPSIYHEEPQVKILPEGKKTGRFLTNMRIGEILFPGGWNKEDNTTKPMKYPNGKCLNFYVASYNKYDLAAVDCLKIRPNWMGSVDYISKTPLKNLFIPGTHSSGAYYNNLKDKSVLLKYFGYAQNFDVWSQLVFGIRFLDLHVGYNEKDNNIDGGPFWIINENLFINPLRIILNDIRTFALASEEIVIIDFSHLTIGFNKDPDRCKSFLKYIEITIGDIALSKQEANSSWRSYDLTLKDIRDKGKHLLITIPLDHIPCGDTGIFEESSIIWPSWKSHSLGILDTSSALSYMRTLFARPLTNEGWIFHFNSNLEGSYGTERDLQTTRQRASDLNSKIAAWLGGPWSLTANVITVDFFTSTNLIDIATYANRHKAYVSVNKNFTIIDIPS